MPDRPASSASRKACGVLPKTETRPRPDTATGGCTSGTLSSRQMAVQQSAGARGFVVAALLLVIAAVSTAQAPPGSSFDESYRRAQQANAALKTLAGRFTETTTSALLTRPL